jgi:hypothetical protein
MAGGIAQIMTSASSNIDYTWNLSPTAASLKTAAVLFADGNLPPSHRDICSNVYFRNVWRFELTVNTTFYQYVCAVKSNVCI